MQFSAFALCYGPYTDLAKRCLGPLFASAVPGAVRDIRIGLNAVSAETRDYVHGACANAQVPCFVFTPKHGANVGKYPLMRRMFQDPQRPPAAWTMWFDDDSYILKPATFFQAIEPLTQRCDMLGELWRIRLKPSQLPRIKNQPWYAGVPLRSDGSVVFCTGGWWAAKTGILQKWDYPFPALHHNGGDSILGMLCLQQGHRLLAAGKHAKTPLVAVNRATRRGLRTPWVWESDTGLKHHAFEVEREAYGA